MPASLIEVLRQDGIEIRDSSFEGGLSARQTMDKFWEHYRREGFKDKRPRVYAVSTITAQETVLQDRETRMVHVGGLEERLEGVAPFPRKDGSLPSEPSEPEPLLTDMFVFFHAKTGEHLVTVHLGPAEG